MLNVIKKKKKRRFNYCLKKKKDCPFFVGRHRFIIINTCLYKWRKKKKQLHIHTIKKKKKERERDNNQRTTKKKEVDIGKLESVSSFPLACLFGISVRIDEVILFPLDAFHYCNRQSSWGDVPLEDDARIRCFFFSFFFD